MQAGEEVGEEMTAVARRRGKELERNVAKRLKGRRVGPAGTATADVLTETLAIECKERKAMPDWLKAAMVQAVGAAQGGRLPLVIVHEHGSQHSADLVITRLADFEDWYGRVPDEALRDSGGVSDAGD